MLLAYGVIRDCRGGMHAHRRMRLRELRPVSPASSQPLAATAAGPVLGYVFSPSDGTLRGMMGVRGSAQMSASIVPAGLYVAGDASVASRTALLEDGSGSLFAFNLPQPQPVHVVDGLAPGDARTSPSPLQAKTRSLMHPAAPRSP